MGNCISKLCCCDTIEEKPIIHIEYVPISKKTNLVSKYIDVENI